MNLTCQEWGGSVSVGRAAKIPGKFAIAETRPTNPGDKSDRDNGDIVPDDLVPNLLSNRMGRLGT